MAMSARVLEGGRGYIPGAHFWRAPMHKFLNQSTLVKFPQMLVTCMLRSFPSDIGPDPVDGDEISLR